MTYPMLDQNTAADYEVGCEVLGSGGGGSPTPVTAALTALVGSRELKLVRELPDDARVCAIGAMGGPSVLAERLPSGAEYRQAMDLLVRAGAPVPTGIMAVETAGINGPYVAHIALSEGLPLIDADLMGRALPRLEQVSLATDVPLGPLALAAPSGETLLIETRSAESAERILRAALPELGGWGLLVTRPFSASELRGHMVVGTVSRAITLGRDLRQLPPRACGADIAAALHGRLLGSGSIEEVSRHPRQGAFAGGALYLTDSASGAVVRVEFQNEYLLASIDGDVTVTCPDLLILVDPRLRQLVSPEAARARLEVAVIGIEGPRWWKQTPERLARVDPRAFDIDQDPIKWEVA